MGDPHQKTRAACAAVAAALAGTRYAVVGGAACVLLGAGRRTEDVDVVVLKGGIQAARKLLSQAPSINVDPRTRHTTFTPASTDIELLSPPGMFRQAFTEETATLMVTVGDDPVAVLHPLGLLNAKLGTVCERSTDEKRDADYYDILFLLNWLVEHRVVLSIPDIPAATVNYVEALLLAHNELGRDVWERAGWPWA